MYRRPKFLEVLIKIREEMAREADYDTDLFAEMVRSGRGSGKRISYPLSDPEAANGDKPKSKNPQRR